MSKPITRVSFYNSTSIAQLQQFLTDYGPISVGVYANHYSFMQAGKSGYIYCPAGQIDHAVLLVGYNSTHWFIKNSWDTTWGDKGFGYILKSNDCGITKYVNIAEVSTTPIPVINIVLTITMTDSYGDGWNGNVLTIKQGTKDYNFGGSFKSGKTSGPLSITINGNMEASIQVYTLGTKTQEIGFTVKFPNGTVLFTQSPGVAFQSNKLFKVFCSLSACSLPLTTDYYLTMTDSYGDGWNGNVLAFKQGNIIKTFG